MSDDEILTVKELAAYLKIAEKTAYRFASEGRLPGFKVGGAWRFRKSEIDQWTKEQSTGGKNESGTKAE
jgi:excisionase family DNA binding protein